MEADAEAGDESWSNMCVSKCASLWGLSASGGLHEALSLGDHTLMCGACRSADDSTTALRTCADDAATCSVECEGRVVTGGMYTRGRGQGAGVLAMPAADPTTTSSVLVPLVLCGWSWMARARGSVVEDVRSLGSVAEFMLLPPRTPSALPRRVAGTELSRGARWCCQDAPCGSGDGVLPSPCDSADVDDLRRRARA